MPRPNYALDPPPDAVEIAGKRYQVDTDYRTWLRALAMMKSFQTEEGFGRENARLFRALMKLTLGCLPAARPMEALSALLEFARGYPTAPDTEGAAAEGEILCSLDSDLNWIIVAIRDQHGVDCSFHRREPLHWWEFLLLFHTLSGDHAVLRLMELRGYRGRDPEMLRRKRRVALPRVDAVRERSLLEGINELFYGAK